ncbi:THUMP domain-containing class I SAM-dependent RNA methyltransferase [Salsuginibacillus kocurii]|uniref:THUMP domain-containing class I SAM-dependent RNA methyltransferase n=1 Tax=Salsuginibacillus kocurii TaxID=427078 RepID=UPI00035CC4D7|nr:class I SAM-dependent RNA methyltransferase [Salsuginibacillus kocurii]
MSTLTYIATATMGLEAIVAKELRQLGYEDLQVENGLVRFTGNQEALCRANLWLRTADRIKVEIGSFKVKSFDELFEQTKALPWPEFIPENGEFPVIGRSVKSTLHSVPDCQKIVKKAVVEKLKETYNTSWFEETGELYRIEVSLHKDVATLTLDSTGNGLHKRGYRPFHSRAPLKETLAAALIQLTNWHPDRPFVDPMCGSGTIPIEAAMIGKNIAPGSNRSFVSEYWEWMDSSIWENARIEAEDLAEYDRPLFVSGSDISHDMVELSQQNAEEIGLHNDIQFKQMQVTDLTAKQEYGVIICNPPYGERLEDKKEVAKLYKEMGKTFKSLSTWSYYVLTSDEQFEQRFGKQATKKRKLYNGNIKTDYYQYWGPKPPRV